MEPVKVVLERRVKPGAQAPFETWVRDLLESAMGQPGHQGSSVLTTAGGEYFILLRFASQPELEGWQRSAPVAMLLRQGEDLAQSADQPLVRHGLETWFTLPGRPMLPAPPRWKMAVVTWLALLPQVLLLGFLLPMGLPVVARAAVSTAIPVALLTWVVMPRLTRWLAPWLYARRVG